MSTIEKVMQRLQKQNAVNQDGAEKEQLEAKSTATNGRLRVIDKDQAAPARPVKDSEQIGVVDLNKLGLSGFLDLKSPDQEKFEEYRRIKRPLVINALEREGPMGIEAANLIMVTSSLPGEGKTYSATNLALSISMEKDVSVLLVDCDAHKKALSKLFHCQHAPGVLEYLDQPLMDLSEVIVDTSVSNMSFLPAGRWRRDSVELLAGLRMVEMMREISERYDDRVIIFDAPPLLSCNDSSVLARHVGQVVMVVEAESTPKDLVREALSRLPEERFVGLLFNKAPKTDSAGYYGSYYGPGDI